MQVSYNGFTGELVKLERSTSGKFKFQVGLTETENIEFEWLYDLSIYDSKNQVTHSFSGTKMKDMEFLGGTVKFSG